MRNGKIVLAEIGVGPLSMCFGSLVWSREDIYMDLFEPNPAYISELREAIKTKSNATLFEVAIGDSTGEMEMSDEGTSSSLIGVQSPSVQLPPFSCMDDFDDNSVRFVFLNYSQNEAQIDRQVRKWWLKLLSGGKILIGSTSAYPASGMVKE